MASDSEPIGPERKEGFLVGLLGDVPAFVRGILATMFGTTICFVAMLQLGGLQVPFTNFLTAQLAPKVVELGASIERLNSIVARIERLEVADQETTKRVRKNEVDIEDATRRVLRVERRLGITVGN